MTFHSACATVRLVSQRNEVDARPLIGRRQLMALVGQCVYSCTVATACQAAPPPTALLKARPSTTRTTYASGTHALGFGESRDGWLQVPSNAGDDPLPLIVLFHGAGGSADRFLRRFAPVIEAARLAVLAPDSRGRTWDVVLGEPSTLLDVVSGQRRSSGFGPDVAFLDRALERVFQKVNIDPGRIAVGGFSDGATYALSLGLINGDLFRRVVAFSPGFFVEGEPHGRPRVFVSHGRSDEVLPIDRCSRQIVPLLRQRGYEVTFREFDGRHEVPEAIAREAVNLLVDQH